MQNSDKANMPLEEDITAATEEEAEIDMQGTTSSTPEEEDANVPGEVEENEGNENREAEIEKLQQLVEEAVAADDFDKADELQQQIEALQSE